MQMKRIVMEWINRRLQNFR